MEYPNNSNLNKKLDSKPTEVKEIRAIVTDAKPRKKTLGQKFVNTFIAEDVKDVKKYICEDVLIPTIKRSIVDIVSNGISKLILGESARPTISSSSPISSNGTYISYNSIATNLKNRSMISTRNVYDYQNYTIKNYEKAVEVRDELVELCSVYRNASVSDYYQLIGVPTTSTDNDYGWFELTGIEVLKCGDEWYIDLPRAVALKK